MTGYDNNGNQFSKIYENTGIGFIEKYAGQLEAVYASSVSWGDYDGDGDLDILLTGSSSGGKISKIYENTVTAFTFTVSYTSADGALGTRSTGVLLSYDKLCYPGDTNHLSGYHRETAYIINQSDKQIPLVFRIVGSDTVLNDADPGTGTSSKVPVAVFGGLSFSSVSAGQAHSCGVGTAGAAYCWGLNRWGQLGDGTQTSRLTPVQVSGP